MLLSQLFKYLFSPILILQLCKTFKMMFPQQHQSGKFMCFLSMQSQLLCVHAQTLHFIPAEWSMRTHTWAENWRNFFEAAIEKVVINIALLMLNKTFSPQILWTILILRRIVFQILQNSLSNSLNSLNSR